MPELFLELFSEEIPARMQARAAADLERLIGEALAPLRPAGIRGFHGPRRIAVAAEVAERVAGGGSVERGPRTGAPEQAVAGFLRKHGASREQLRREGDHWVLEKTAATVSASELVASAIPPLLRRFPWPKSMRWGGTSGFTWVRPLRRIVCLLDREVVRFDLRDGTDDGHGLRSDDLTEGHRFLSPGAFPVVGCADWAGKLRARRVLVDAAERRRVIAERIAASATAKNLTVVDDPGLLDEVAGLVEWPVPLLGRIDDAYMDLPPEVMQVSMRVNQRYFALRTAEGAAAPYFAFVANIEAEDGGAAIIAGNERVLRARFADARHFWDLDRRTRLQDRVKSLDEITFHAKLGSQGARVDRLRPLAREIARLVGAPDSLAERAAELAKADLVTGMVAEFPELQGVMGRYYALHDDEPPDVADAIRDHYAPRGPGEATPYAPISIAVALADKFDLLAGFFSIGEKPSGSGDPYALRRAALGIIRLIRENRLNLSLRSLIDDALVIYGTLAAKLDPAWNSSALIDEITTFILERLIVRLRSEGDRYDILRAVFAAGALHVSQQDNILDLLTRKEAIARSLETPDGTAMLVSYRRAANIILQEGRKDGPFTGDVDPELLVHDAERHMLRAWVDLDRNLSPLIENRTYEQALRFIEVLGPIVSAFLDTVTVNDKDPGLRRNRLRLLTGLKSTMDRVADFSRIEG